jgi:cytidylate kinase
MSRMTIVTVSASFGAGGAVVGPKLAERLGVPFLDRAIPSEVAERLAIPLEEAAARDDSIGGLLSRVALRLAPIGLAFGAETTPDTIDEESYRRTTEAIIREHAASGSAVILGRAGALVLRNDPRSLHVRLDGPRERRIEQALRLDTGSERAEIGKRLDETDRAREAYVRHFYRADARDAAHYHLTIDATAIPLDAVVELIVLAAASRTR